MALGYSTGLHAILCVVVRLVENDVQQHHCYNADFNDIPCLIFITFLDSHQYIYLVHIIIYVG